MTLWDRIRRWLRPAPQTPIEALQALAEPGRAPPATVAPPPRLAEEQRRADSFFNAISGLGTGKDPGAAGRPDVERTPLTRAELDSLYRNNPYANRHVTNLPREACRKGWKVTDGTRRVDAMAAENRRLDVLGRVRQAAMWARKDGRSILLMVCDETTPPGVSAEMVLRTPLRPENLRRVVALQVFDAVEAQPWGWVRDPRSLHYRQPEAWNITPVGGGALMGVHHTRVLVFGGTPLPPSLRVGTNWTDDPVLSLSFDAVQQRTSLAQAGATAGQQLSHGVLTINDAKDVTTGPESLWAEVKLKAIAVYRSLLNVTVLSAGETYEEKAKNIAGFGDLAASANEGLALAQGEPQVRLFGTAPSGLNTDGENQRGIWATVVSGWWAEALKPQLIQLYTLIYRSSEGPTHGVEPAAWDVELLPLDELTAQGEANLRKTVAEADAILIQAGIVPAEHIARSRYSAEGYTAGDLLPFDPDAADAALLARAQAQLAAAEAQGAAPARTVGAPPVPSAPTAVAPSQEDAAEDIAATFAAELTEHGIERCPHDLPNRCRICGIERVRGVVTGDDGKPLLSPDGKPVWKVAWRPIPRSPVASAPVPA